MTSPSLRAPLAEGGTSLYTQSVLFISEISASNDTESREGICDSDEGAASIFVTHIIVFKIRVKVFIVAGDVVGCKAFSDIIRDIEAEIAP